MDNINNKTFIVVHSDGKFESFGDINNYDEHHIDHLLDYAYFNYPKINLTNENKSDAFNKIIYYLTEANKVVYLHSQGYGLLFMPKHQTQRQIETLYNIFETLEKTYIYINYDLKLDENGKLEGTTSNQLENTSAIDEYLDIKNHNQTIKNVKNNN